MNTQKNRLQFLVVMLFALVSCSRESSNKELKIKSGDDVIQLSELIVSVNNDLEISETVDLGSISKGLTIKQTIQLKNPMSSDFILTAQDFNSSDLSPFEIESNGCIGTIKGRKSCSIIIKISNIQNQSEDVELEKILGIKSGQITLTGTLKRHEVLPVAGLDVSPSLLNFGSLKNTQSKELTVIVQNNSGSSQTIAPLSNNPKITINNSCGILDNRKKCSFKVKYTASEDETIDNNPLMSIHNQALSYSVIVQSPTEANPTALAINPEISMVSESLSESEIKEGSINFFNNSGILLSPPVSAISSHIGIVITSISCAGGLSSRKNCLVKYSLNSSLLPEGESSQFIKLKSGTNVSGTYSLNLDNSGTSSPAPIISFIPGYSAYSSCSAATACMGVGAYVRTVTSCQKMSDGVPVSGGILDDCLAIASGLSIDCNSPSGEIVVAVDGGSKTVSCLEGSSIQQFVSLNCNSGFINENNICVEQQSACNMSELAEYNIDPENVASLTTTEPCKVQTCSNGFVNAGMACIDPSKIVYNGDFTSLSYDQFGFGETFPTRSTFYSNGMVRSINIDPLESYFNGLYFDENLFSNVNYNFRIRERGGVIQAKSMPSYYSDYEKGKPVYIKPSNYMVALKESLLSVENNMRGNIPVVVKDNKIYAYNTNPVSFGYFDPSLNAGSRFVVLNNRPHEVSLNANKNFYPMGANHFIVGCRTGAGSTFNNNQSTGFCIYNNLNNPPLVINNPQSYNSPNSSTNIRVCSSENMNYALVVTATDSRYYFYSVSTSGILTALSDHPSNSPGFNPFLANGVACNGNSLFFKNLEGQVFKYNRLATTLTNVSNTLTALIPGSSVSNIQFLEYDHQADGVLVRSSTQKIYLVSESLDAKAQYPIGGIKINNDVTTDFNVIDISHIGSQKIFANVSRVSDSSQHFVLIDRSTKNIEFLHSASNTGPRGDTVSGVTYVVSVDNKVYNGLYLDSKFSNISAPSFGIAADEPADTLTSHVLSFEENVKIDNLESFGSIGDNLFLDLSTYSYTANGSGSTKIKVGYIYSEDIMRIQGLHSEQYATFSFFEGFDPFNPSVRSPLFSTAISPTNSVSGTFSPLYIEFEDGGFGEIIGSPFNTNYDSKGLRIMNLEDKQSFYPTDYVEF